MLKKRFIVSIVFLLISLSISIYAPSLPSQGGNNNDWGSTLNAWLDVAHDSTGNLRSDYVTSSMIASQTITANDIAPGAINITHFGAITQINTTHIADQTIAAGDFGVGQINSTHIEDSSVHGVDIWNESITTMDIKNDTILSADISLNQINTSHILDATVASADIADDTITTSDIANQTIAANDIAPGAINITHFGAITQINSTHLLDSTIASIDIANDSISSGDIGTGQINSTHLLDSTIASIDIANGSIAGGDIDQNTTLNASGLVVGNITFNTNTTIRSIYYGSFNIDIGALAPYSCVAMGNSLPNNNWLEGSICIPVVNIDYTNATFANLSVAPMNSTGPSDSCRIRVCNHGLNSISTGSQVVDILVISTNLLS